MLLMISCSGPSSSCTQPLLTWSTQAVTTTAPSSVLPVPPAPLVTFMFSVFFLPHTALWCQQHHRALCGCSGRCKSISTQTTTQAVPLCSHGIGFWLFSTSILQLQHQDSVKGRKSENKGIRCPSLHLNMACISACMLRFLKFPSYRMTYSDLLSTRVCLYRYQQTNPIN